MKKIIYIIIVILIGIMLYVGNNIKKNKGIVSMNGIKTIEQTWNKIFSYWETVESKPYCKGATKEEIKTLKDNLKLELPDTFIRSLEICNGEILEKAYEKKYNEEIKKNPYQNIKLGIIRLFDINKILEYRYVGEDTPEEWIPLAYWYGTYNVVLDTREATFGQVLFGIVEDDHFKVWTNSYEEWLELMAKEVEEHGEVREDMLYQIYKDNTLKKLEYPDY